MVWAACAANAPVYVSSVDGRWWVGRAVTGRIRADSGTHARRVMRASEQVRGLAYAASLVGWAHQGSGYRIFFAAICGDADVYAP